jgi:hypothetical protein
MTMTMKSRAVLSIFLESPRSRLLPAPVLGRTPLWTMFAGLVLLSTGSFTTAKAQQVAPPVVPHVPSVSSYAEGLYNEYSTATAGAISFSVQTIESGPLTTIAGMPFNNLITVPPYRIVTDQTGTIFSNPSFILPEDPSEGLFDMGYTADKFAQYGYPLEDGAFRKLYVTAIINGDTRSHEAIEFCWAALNHCAVLDPVVLFLESKVAIRQSLAAAGWSVQKTGQTANSADTTPGDTTASGRCGLASHPSWSGEQLTWKPYTATAKDIFGITLWKLYLAEQVDGITCNSRCRPEPFSISNASSAFAQLGYKAACNNRGATGISGHTARAIAETKCVEDFLGKVHASVKVDGKGAAISLDWSLGGSVFSNGGVFTDTCARF